MSVYIMDACRERERNVLFCRVLLVIVWRHKMKQGSAGSSNVLRSDSGNAAFVDAQVSTGLSRGATGDKSSVYINTMFVYRGISGHWSISGPLASRNEEVEERLAGDRTTKMMNGGEVEGEVEEGSECFSTWKGFVLPFGAPDKRRRSRWLSGD